jgi:colanic acid/amylovoran biosynthesis glycosyltransferase
MTLATAAAARRSIVHLRKQSREGSAATASAQISGQATSAPAPVLYLVNQYPAVSHTFIRREILALEELGFVIDRVALRRGQGIVDPVDQDEERKTTYLLQSKTKLFKSALAGIAAKPAGFLKALGLTARMCWRSDRGPDKHLIYLIEACALAKHARSIGAGHLHAHFGTNSAEVAMLAAAIAGIGYSLTIHGAEEYDRPEFLGLRLKMHRARFVATVSHYGRAQMLRWCADGDEKKITLIRCGLDLDGNRPARMPENPPARFVSVARFCRLKGHETLLAAFAEVLRRGHVAELVLVGDGETRNAIERQIDALSLRSAVRITSWLGNDAVRREIEASRALVVPSYAENLPVVIMESFAYGRPVIASVIAGIPELVVSGENGWLVPASSVEALADAMEQCLLAPATELARRAAQGLALVHRFHDIRGEASKQAALFPEHVQPPKVQAAAKPSVAGQSGSDSSVSNQPVKAVALL